MNGEHEAFYLTAEFWVLVAFVIFVVAAFRPVARTLTAMLDERAAKIRQQLDEAERLRVEAQAMLATYQRKQRDALKEAEEMVAHAKREAERISANAQRDLENTLQRREQLAMERIAQAETAAMREVSTLATEVAIKAAETLIAENLSAKQAGAMIDQAIKELPEKLH